MHSQHCINLFSGTTLSILTVWFFIYINKEALFTLWNYVRFQNDSYLKPLRHQQREYLETYQIRLVSFKQFCRHLLWIQMKFKLIST